MTKVNLQKMAKDKCSAGLEVLSSGFGHLSINKQPIALARLPALRLYNKVANSLLYSQPINNIAILLNLKYQKCG